MSTGARHLSYLLLIFTGCAGATVTDQNGILLVQSDVSRSVGCPFPRRADFGNVTVIGSGLTRALVSSIPSSNQSVSFGNVPVGEKFVRVDVFDGMGMLIGTNTAKVNITANGFHSITVNPTVALPESWNVRGTTDIDGVSWTRVDRQIVFALLRETEDGPQKLLTEFSITQGRFAEYSPALTFAPLSLAPGQQKVQTTRITDFGSPRLENQTILFVGQEGVSTPAGDFPVSLHFRYSPRFSLLSQSFTDIWFARDVGPVMAVVDMMNEHAEQGPTMLTDLLLSFQTQGAGVFPLTEGNNWTNATNAVGCAAQ